jgi:hypothetical protein
MVTKDDFDKWLDVNGWELPLCAWGPDQTKISVRFASDMAQAAVRGALDETLNSGDGAYRP